MAVSSIWMLIILAFSLSYAQGESQSTKSHESSYLDAFFIHVEDVYLRGKKINELSHIEKAKLLGYALGRQASNVQNIKRRNDIFKRLESDLERYFGVLASTKYTSPSEAVQAKYLTNQLWRISQGAMMGFYEDEITVKYGIDPWNIPNIFEQPDQNQADQADQQDPNSLVGQWKPSITGDIVRFVEEGNVLKAYMVSIGRSRLFIPGELWGIFRKTGRNVYVGKAKMKLSTGDWSWLEDIKLVVEGKTAWGEAPWLRAKVAYIRQR